MLRAVLRSQRALTCTGAPTLRPAAVATRCYSAEAPAGSAQADKADAKPKPKAKSAVAKPKSPSPQNQRYLRLNVRMEGVDYTVLDSFVELCRRTAKELGIACTGRIPLPTKVDKVTVLKSPHVSKKHRQQFGRIIHNRLIQVYNASDLTMNTYKQFLEHRCPEGVICRLTEYHHKSLPQRLQSALNGKKPESQPTA